MKAQLYHLNLAIKHYSQQRFKNFKNFPDPKPALSQLILNITVSNGKMLKSKQMHNILKVHSKLLVNPS